MSRYDKSIKSIFTDMTEDLVRLMTGSKVRKKSELNIEFTKVEKRISDMVIKCEMDEKDIAAYRIPIYRRPKNAPQNAKILHRNNGKIRPSSISAYIIYG